VWLYRKICGSYNLLISFWSQNKIILLVLKKRKKIFLLSFIYLFHLIGIISSLLRPKKSEIFHLTFHLLRFFSWWSVHTSILTILAVILIQWKRKKNPAYFPQLLTLVATIYNLVTFVFILSYFLAGKIISDGIWLDLQLFTWHFVAPLLTISYFYFYARIDQLIKSTAKLIMTLSLALTWPIFYFFYVFILAKINNKPTGSLSPYMKKYPYYIFEWITERSWYILVANFLIASLIFISLCALVLWTKNLWDKKVKKLV